MYLFCYAVLIENEYAVMKSLLNISEQNVQKGAVL